MSIVSTASRLWWQSWSSYIPAETVMGRAPGRTSFQVHFGSRYGRHSRIRGYLLYGPLPVLPVRDGRQRAA